ncbi:Maltooligosyl trehalose synthase [Candidatus Sulfopaludibacter sp. SbA4]|nr:Maltooligosyl trehalose synthase [Candidatus Sulfopaludibacter sp. SbA4]
MRIPLSTYRLQFGRGFGFREARRLVPYLHRLGISDVYASPIFRARSDQASGYDVADPTSLDPRLGSRDEFLEFSAELKRHDMGLLLDIVPNHMAAHTSNPWWNDVLENGPSSRYAYYFDIEWDPPSHPRSGKMLWPILGAPYAEVLERKEFALRFSADGFAVQYFDRSLPIDPATYGSIIAHMQRALAGNEGCAPLLEEIAAIGSRIQALPPSTATDAEEIARRYREKDELKRRLWELYAANGCFHTRLDESIRIYNGEAGDPRSFDPLDDLLGQQPYVLSYWQVARERVNYRRFFDITDLVGVNIQEPDVFAATHALVFQLVDEGQVTGLRIDHIDGLYDPAEYLRRLRERLPECYIVVEKILEQKETLSREWPVSGTTGYDFINAVTGVTTDAEGLERIAEIYPQIAGGPASLADVVYEQKKRVIAQLFAGEALSLSLHLNLLAEQDRYAKDASPQGLTSALMEVTACLPVYRTYTRSYQIRPPDLLQIDRAFQEARRRNPQVSETIWNFVRRVLLLDCPSSLPAEHRARWRQFVQRWQQFSGPVMAKGKEDTAFYIYNRLISMNEVGGQDHPWSVEEFRQFAEARARCWPHTLNAGTTHDTKRGEDVRTRIQVLAETPDAWRRSVKRWRRWNARLKRVLNGSSVPGPNEEFFIYQTLVGSWPLDPSDMGAYQERLQAYLVKSWREAKLHTSWSSAEGRYESAVAEFVSTILTPHAENHFLPDFLAFQQRIAAYGAFHSLSQTLLRLSLPGVPDIYQGAELWELSLVDPDNRRPVDFERRQTLLSAFTDCEPVKLLENWRDGAVKQYVIQKVLTCRRENAAVFQGGDYLALEAGGRRADHVMACARHSGMAWVAAVAPRFPARLSRSAGPPIGKRVWADTELGFPVTAPRRWSNLFTGESLEVPGTGRVPLAAILRRFPIALLVAHPD